MTPPSSISPRAWAELILLSLIWGGSFFSIAIALREIGAFTVVAHRVFWAALLLWVVVVARRLPVPRDPRIWFSFLVMGCLNNAIPFSLMAWGQLHIETGLTSILNAATAVFGVVTAAVFLVDERLTLRKTVGTSLGFAGVVLAIGPDALADFSLRSVAQLAVIAGTISYALAGVWAKLRLQGLRPEMAAAGMLTASSLIMVPLAAAVDGPYQLALSLDTWLAIGYFAIISTALAYLLYYRVLEMAGSANLMLVTLLIPPTAIVLGTVFLDETLQPLSYLGFGTLALGLLVLDGRIFRFAQRSKPS